MFRFVSHTAAKCVQVAPLVTHALFCWAQRPPSAPSTPLLLSWGPRRILTLAVAARNEQRHKDSVIPHTVPPTERNHSWQATPAFSSHIYIKCKSETQEGTKSSVDYPSEAAAQTESSYISGYCRPKSAQWKKTWMRGRLKKVRMHFSARLGKWIWHGCIMSVSRVPPQRQLHTC